MALTKWECEYPGCPAIAMGQGCAGLRAIGWEVTFGRSSGPVLFCPDHRSPCCSKHAPGYQTDCRNAVTVGEST
jgi:hypothetical protein